MRKTYPKYIDGELSEQERQSVEEHIRDCPDCVAAVNSLQKMSSLLQTAAEVEVSDEYWDTYWDRLESKLPDRPAQVTLTSRMSGFFAEMFRRPVVLGRVAISIIILAFLVYTASDHLIKAPSAPSRAPVMAEDMEEVEAETSVALGKDLKKSEDAGRIVDELRQPVPRMQVGEDESAGTPLERQVSETDLAMGLDLYKNKELAEEPARELSYAAPAKPETAPALSSKMAQALKGSEHAGYALGDLRDEYVVAENHFQRGDYVQAIPAYQNFITANTIANVQDDRTLRAQYQLGEAYYQTKNYSDALSNFVAVANADKAERADTNRGQTDYFYEREAGLKKDEKAKGVETLLRLQAERKVRARGRREPQTRRGTGVAGDGIEASGKMDDDNLSLTETLKTQIPTETREELVSRAIFRQAQSYEHLKRNAEALATYRIYIERYPQGGYISQAKEKIAQQVAKPQAEAQQQEKAGKAKIGEKKE